MQAINEMIEKARALDASDIHLVSGLPIKYRVDGRIETLFPEVLTPEDCEAYARELAGEKYEEIEEIGELDMARSFPCGVRTRINLFRQQNAVSAAIRLLKDKIPELDTLGLPAVVADFPKYRSGIEIGRAHV